LDKPKRKISTYQINNHRPKLAFVFYQTDSLANGGLRSMVNIVKELRKYEVYLITNTHSQFTNELVESGAKLIIKPFSTAAFGKLKSIVKLLFWFRSFIRKHQISLIHANDINALHHVLPAVLGLKIKVFLTIRGIKEANQAYGNGWKVLNMCYRVVVLSEEMKNELIRRLPVVNKKLLETKIKVIHSIVEIEKFKPARGIEKQELKRKLFKSKTKNFNLLYVATFCDLKNQLNFIKEALPLLKGKNVIVHFLGDFAPQKNAYANKCREALEFFDVVDMVVFHGYRDNMADYYRSADLTLVPSRREGMARSMIESLACGTPVVSFDVASAHEILSNNETGIVVPQGDYQQMAKEIIGLLGDTSRFMEYSINAVEITRTFFKKEAVVEAYHNLYLS
jgi:glycosyltransferase involved in cell wall biosynthesis